MRQTTATTIVVCVWMIAVLVACRKPATSVRDPAWEALGEWERLSPTEKSAEQVDAYLAKNPGDIVRLVGVLTQFSTGKRPKDERLEQYTLLLIERLPSASVIQHANTSRVIANPQYRDRLVARLEEQVAKGQTNHGVYDNLAFICELGTWVIEPKRREQFLRWHRLPADTELPDKPDPLLLAKAIRYYGAAADAAKGDPFYEGFHLEALGRLFRINKRFAEAAKACERALPVTGDTSRSSLLVTYGKCLKGADKPDEAEKQLRKVRKADGKSYEQGPGCATMEAETLLGQIALQRGDVKSACQRLKASTDVNRCCHNTTAGFPLSLAEELLKRGEADAVIAHCKRVLKDFTPKDTETEALLKNAQEAKGKR